MPHSARVARSLRSLAARFDSQAGTATWVIVNYDVLGRHRDALEECDWAALVFDEAHYLKNHMSARSKLARGLTDSASTKTPHPLIVQLLTGTPLTSRSISAGVKSTKGNIAGVMASHCGGIRLGGTATV